MEYILDNINFSDTEIVFLSVFFALLLIQLLIYILYYAKPVGFYNKKVKKNLVEKSSKQVSVSVIIVSKNESENLRKNLPAILEQDYPDFEVIVVNDGSTDESEELLNLLEQKYSNLYHTFSPDSRDRKLSMTIGIKAAQKDILLFTEASCQPVSNLWIKKMAEKFTPEKEIVLGYSFFAGKSSPFLRIARFDNIFFSLQYLSKAIRKHPYTGTYRNLAFRKNLFFDNKGFSSVLNYDSCEEVFINKMVDKMNTDVCLEKQAFTKLDLDSFSSWKGLKVSYFRAKNFFKKKGYNIFSIDTCSRYLFYFVFVFFLIYAIRNASWIFLSVIGTLFFIRYITQLIIINKACKHFNTPGFFSSIIFWDLIQPLYNLKFRFTSRKKDNQKYKSSHM